jgi:hypothetical protein
MSRTTFLAFTGAALAIGTLASTTASAGFPQGHPSSTARVGFSTVHQPQPAVNRFSNVHLPQAAINRISNVQLPNHVSSVHTVPSQTNSSQPNTGGGATSVFNRPQSGGIGGLGVPGGLKPGSVGSDILKGNGISTSTTPSSTSDTAKTQVGGIKTQQGGAVGVQPQDGLSPHQLSNLQNAVQNAKNSAGGTAAGVQQPAGVSPGQASNLHTAAQMAQDSATGAAAGVQGKDPGVHLSNAQLQAIRNVQVNPVINQGTANDSDDNPPMRTPAEVKKVMDKILAGADRVIKPVIMPPAHIEGHVPKPPNPK